MSGEKPTTVVIGAGPAGLTAAYALAKQNLPVQVFEADKVVGGISQTVERDGWRFDIGGHRFFTKVPEVEALWHEILPDEDFLLRPRMSRIYYRGKLFDYPLKAMNALRNLGVWEAVRCVASYTAARIRPPKDQSHFEGWVSARFGWRLYSIFFKTYTEKVWGMPATALQADWAAQRIKNLSLSSAVINAIMPKRNQKDIASLIEEFQYPKYGPGMMWERCTEHVEKLGGSVAMQTWVKTVHRDPETKKATAVDVADATGERRVPLDHLISSMPLSELVLAMEPAADHDAILAAKDLHYRDFLTVALVVPQEFSFPDNWIYIHDPHVKVGRIQNFGSWSPYMVKDGRTCLGMEYFVFENDEMWVKSDDDLVAFATAELERLGLVKEGAVEVGYVVRMPKAYPTYDETYQRNVEVLRAWLDANTTNVHPVGRNGMHRYNNADHSMMTALLTAENIASGTNHDVWEVNVEEEYHEEKSTSDGGAAKGTGRSAPVIPRQKTPVDAASTADVDR
ncbi:NAD(P)/FAD-dependent oxidoreductase [Dactylosporangium aurantiacum]|uniref:NAD(P)/FAD-dependent oxidoreductase n=1 Tax=Dactylosporangium aurantiacum TaxID=35754 RepID=A0A9Q9MHQ2_9ACTN|nr:NAD(P)/FAD-dependent oxidoreductase [Dactylosporangium aurantiacum]MDG6100851.1 NAD(P)/FAD-dependent oxidoreductase [Dactylosporangium aurantiacum]UWZ55090.1 NAD(P)/FAD-dependent oxidoreductase [Dactylosporangium aurantiacum]